MVYNVFPVRVRTFVPLSVPYGVRVEREVWKTVPSPWVQPFYAHAKQGSVFLWLLSYSIAEEPYSTMCTGIEYLKSPFLDKCPAAKQRVNF